MFWRPRYLRRRRWFRPWYARPLYPRFGLARLGCLAIAFLFLCVFGTIFLTFARWL
jgi:hypothetical protein